jgi:hypothetical protein
MLFHQFVQGEAAFFQTFQNVGTFFRRKMSRFKSKIGSNVMVPVKQTLCMKIKSAPDSLNRPNESGEDLTPFTSPGSNPR